MSANSIVPRRAARRADIDRTMKAVKAAGYDVASIRVSADGSFEVVTGEPTKGARVDDLDAWRAQRDAEYGRRG